MVQIGAHSKRPGPDAEDAKIGGESDSPNASSGGRHASADAAGELAGSASAASWSPAPSPSGSRSPSGSFWPEESGGLTEGSSISGSAPGSPWTPDPLSPSGSVFKLKAPMPESEPDEPLASPSPVAEEPAAAAPSPSPAEYSPASDFSSYAAPRASEPDEPVDSTKPIAGLAAAGLAGAAGADEWAASGRWESSSSAPSPTSGDPASGEPASAEPASGEPGRCRKLLSRRGLGRWQRRVVGGFARPRLWCRS